MVRVLALMVFSAISRFPAQKRSLFSVNALVVIGQEPSVYTGLHDSGLLRNYTYRTRHQPASASITTSC